MGTTLNEYEEKLVKNSWAIILEAVDNELIMLNPAKPTIAIEYAMGMPRTSRIKKQKMPITPRAIGLNFPPPF
jgi:hypothetical protein